MSKRCTLGLMVATIGSAVLTCAPPPAQKPPPAPEVCDNSKDDNGNGYVDFFNYGFDLGVRGQERNKLMQALEGPEKAIERSVKAMGIAGIPRTIAIKLVVNQLIEQGELPADYVFPEA